MFTGMGEGDPCPGFNAVWWRRCWVDRVREKEFFDLNKLRTFQKQFIRRALAPGVDVAALSLSRGNGKSWLAAHLLTRCLTPGMIFMSQAASISYARPASSKPGCAIGSSGRSLNLRASTVS